MSEKNLPVCNLNSNFLDVVKEFGYPLDLWVDKRMWRLNIYNDEKYVCCLDFIISDLEARVSIGGVGGCQYLIAKTPDELRDNINAWIRHRH